MDGGPVGELAGEFVGLGVETSGGTESTRALGVRSSAGFRIGESEPSDRESSAQQERHDGKGNDPISVPVETLKSRGLSASSAFSHSA